MGEPLVIHDEDVMRLANMPAAIAEVEKVLSAATGFTSPPRHRVDFGAGAELVLTIGGSSASVGGVRTYFTRHSQHSDDQAVMVWDMQSGAMRGIVLGSALSALRMGAIAGAAMRRLTPPKPMRVAIFGTGRQARSHLEAIAAVRPILEARVHGRSRERAEAMVDEFTGRFPISVAASGQDAADEADIVILATTSLRPVIEAAWLKSTAVVHTVGFKSPVGKEMGLDVPDMAQRVVTDSLAQVEASGRTFVLSGTRHLARITSLHDLPVDPAEAMSTASYPMGLAGTDIVIADLLLRAASAHRVPLNATVLDTVVSSA